MRKFSWETYARAHGPIEAIGFFEALYEYMKALFGAAKREVGDG